MYDGTIIPLHKKPGLDGDAYYTRKSNYGLNAQVSILLSLKLSEKLIGTNVDRKYTLKS
jgi:hypothetical protein